jgi:hypothetical protein
MPFVGIGVGIGRQRFASGGFVGLLDSYPNAAAAYSLRQLRGTYTGDAIRVRRASDNTEQDIGFVNNELDTSALTTFCSGTNGFVTTWYDQSGNSLNATQSTALQQPQIVSAGSLLIENGKPCIVFDGSSDNLPITTIGGLPANISSFAVRSFASYPNTFRTIYNYKTYGLTHNSNGGVGSYGVAHIFSSNTTVLSNNYPTTTGQALDFTFNKANLERNNFAATILGGGSYGAGTSAIGSFNGTIQPFLGNIQELVIYESNKNSDKSGIKTNINDFYSIY